MPLPDPGVNRERAADTAVEHVRTWLAWAATQVELCLADDKPACDQLLESIADILEPSALRGSCAEPAGDSPASDKMAAVIVAVQSHDRIMQQLAHVRDSLRVLHEYLGDAQRAQSAESWRALRQRQLREFSMADERALFTRLVAHEDAGWREPAMNPEETIELFAAQDGVEQS
jgi:hypothetical protein